MCVKPARAKRCFCCAQVISISDPNERDVCHTLELRIHECALQSLCCRTMLLPPQRLTGAYQASMLAEKAPFPVLSLLVLLRCK